MINPMWAEMTPRWGTAACVLRRETTSTGRAIPLSQQYKFFIVGGDDHKEDSGGGGYHNDVWYAVGAAYSAVNQYHKHSQYGSFEPRIVSRTTWARALPDTAPPRDTDYREWLCCLESVPWRCEQTSCEPVDPFAEERKFAPRRNAVLVSHGGYVMLMGGRGSSLQVIDPSKAVGSLPYGSGARFPAILLSDIWRSKDGVTWELVNPGCYSQQEDLVRLPGLVEMQCRTSDQCTNRRLGEAKCSNSVCVCTMWGPREHFGAVSLGSKLYVFGGSTAVTSQMCGNNACGDGYTRYLNDAWRSEDNGNSWIQLTSAGAWTPRRAFGAVVLDNVIWLMGGQTGSEVSYGAETLLNDVWYTTDGVNWAQNGTATWTARSHFGAAVVGSKIYIHGGQTVVDPLPSPDPLDIKSLVDKATAMADRRVVVLDPSPSPYVDPRPGETASGVRYELMPDVWSFDSVQPHLGWQVDFAASAEQSTYANPDDSWLQHDAVEQFNATREQLDVLASVGVESVRDLLGVDDSVLQALQDGLDPETQAEGAGPIPNVCAWLHWAQSLVFSCDYRYIPYDGEYARNFVIDEALAIAHDVGADAEAAAIAEEAATFCGYAPRELLPGQCRIVPLARHSAALGEIEDRLVLGLGYLGPNKRAHDYWVREDIEPKTRITLAPQSGSFETLFGFECSRPSCLFEYRLLELGSLDDEDGTIVNDWTYVLPPLDVGTSMYSAFFRLEVRAVDAAYNRDTVIQTGRNAYNWEYVAPIPWLWIILGTLLFIIIVVVLYTYWKRQQRKRAMMKFAMRRMKKKLKAVQEGDFAAFDADKEKDPSRKSKKRKKKGKHSKKDKGKSGKSKSKSSKGKST